MAIHRTQKQKFDNNNKKSTENQEDNKDYTEFLQLEETLKTKINQELEKTDAPSTPKFWEMEETETHYIPIKDGEIRAFHIKPANPISKRPLVFIPGWGVVPPGFQNLYEVIHEKVELFYIETREKGSSHLNRKEAELTVSQKAEDITKAIDYFGLKDKDFVLQGACWGASVILEGVMKDILTAPTIVLQDPMNKLWFPFKFLEKMSKFIPVFLVKILKPILKFFALFGMKAKAQKERTKLFIDSADIWKWKNTFEACKNFRLLGRLGDIKKELFVFNGTTDRIHDQAFYPKIAQEIPNGRFIYLETDESRRERLAGLIAREFTKVTSEDGIPKSLAPYEKDLRKTK
jgi:hypothetical protein